MEIKYSDKNIGNIKELTSKNSLDEYFFPDMELEFELKSMHVRKAKSSWHYPTHEHPLYEINLVTSGQQIFTIQGKQYLVNEGDLVLIRPGVLHSSAGNKESSEEEFSYLCIHFYIDDKLFLPYFKETTDSYYDVNSKLNRSIRPLLDRLMNFSKTSKLGFKEKMNIHSIMFELLGLIVSSLEEKDNNLENVSERTIGIAYKIARKIDLLIRKPTEMGNGEDTNSRIEDIAEELDYSVSYCNKVFKKVFNMSPRQYVSFRKLNESKSLLMEEKYSIEQIAFMMGYS
ncbi:MAG: AraC family transcriptional regulator [Bacillus sp. (in: Bacteria)]|nr:AraC family transcriptional regulator [Bacillus sp. (in: firmicutes)]